MFVTFLRTKNVNNVSVCRISKHLLNLDIPDSCVLDSTGFYMF